MKGHAVGACIDEVQRAAAGAAPPGCLLRDPSERLLGVEQLHIYRDSGLHQGRQPVLMSPPVSSARPPPPGPPGASFQVIRVIIRALSPYVRECDNIKSMIGGDRATVNIVVMVERAPTAARPTRVPPSS